MAMAMAGASTSLITPCLPSNPQISSAGSVFRSGHLGNVFFLRSGPVVVRALPRSRLVVSAKIREIFMPALSSTMTEGKIVSWIKSEGEKLAKGDSVVVVESDKADMDVETFYDGYLAAIMVGEGEVAPVGAAIALLAEKEEEIAEAKSKASSAPTSQTTPVEELRPKVEENVSIPAPSPTPTPVSLPKPATVVQPIVASTHPASEGGTRIVATPYAKKLAKEYGIDLRTVAGTGPQGRVVANDVEAAVVRAGTSLETSPSPVPAVVKKESPLTPSVISVSGSEAAFSGMQAAVARNMVESLAVPVFRVGYTINTDAIDALYKKIKSKGVTMSALLAKAAALALVQHPVVNASCKDGKAFVYNASINIAVAVAIDGGLITPVLKDADKVDIYSLSKAWKELVDKARMKQLQPHEYSTGTFTLSNLGMFGVDRFDAILPPGSGAIMAVGASRQTVVASKDGFFGVKNQMQVNVTADHRIIYGADLAAFLQTFAKLVEEPSSLTL